MKYHWVRFINSEHREIAGFDDGCWYKVGQDKSFCGYEVMEEGPELLEPPVL